MCLIYPCKTVLKNMESFESYGLRSEIGADYPSAEISGSNFCFNLNFGHCGNGFWGCVKHEICSMISYIYVRKTVLRYSERGRRYCV